MELATRVTFSFLFAAAGTLCACSSSDEGPGTGPNTDKPSLLDPAETHYGRTYGELAQEWVQHIFDFAPPACEDPLSDVTGAKCQLNQNDDDVFFLVGTSGGIAERSECEVPGDKALYFPLVNTWADNAGLTPEQVFDEAELLEYAQQAYDDLLPDSVHLEVDGTEFDVDDLKKGLVLTEAYTVNFPSGDNAYTCFGQDGVEGDFAGRTSGYYVLLAPLGSGDHEITFGGSSRDDGQNEQSVNVTYTFTAP